MPLPNPVLRLGSGGAPPKTSFPFACLRSCWSGFEGGGHNTQQCPPLGCFIPEELGVSLGVEGGDGGKNYLNPPQNPPPPT